MDLLLAHGYLLAEDPHERRIMKPYPPLGILSLHAYLSTKGFSTRVLDPTFLSWEETADSIRKANPSALGIYCTLMTKRTVLRMIDVARSMEIPVILGGPEPAVYAEEFLRAGADVVVIGEGEETLEELLPVMSGRDPARLGRVAGIAFLDASGACVRTHPRPMIQDLDGLPLPDRTAIDMDSYLRTWKSRHGGRSLSIITARGCPYTCTWCSHGVYGYTHRRRTPASVTEEIRLLRSAYNPDMLWFADDVFTISHPWLREFRDLMVRNDLVTPFECITRADRLSDEMLDILRELRCFRIWIGSESGSDHILKGMSRGVDTGTITTMTKKAQSRGIEVGLFVMLGYEGETMEDIDQTIEHLKRTGADTFLTTVAYPLKGTPFYEKVASRITRPGAWNDTTDRDLTIRGRYSNLFYWFAVRRLTNEVGYARSGPHASLLTRTSLKSKSLVARLGMRASSFARS